MRTPHLAWLIAIFMLVHCVSSQAQDEEKRFAELVKELKDDDFEVRMEAAYGLAKFGSKAVNPLVVALADEDEDVLFAVEASLVRIGPSGVEKLIKANENPTLRDRIPSILGKMPREAAPQICQLLENEKTELKLLGARTLEKMGKKANSHGRALAPLLDEKDTRLRRAGILALASLGTVDSTLAAKAAHAIKDVDPMVRIGALKFMAVNWIHAEKYLEVIASSLEEDSWEVQEAAANALGKLGPLAEGALEKLIGAMKRLYPKDHEYITKGQHLAGAIINIGPIVAFEVAKLLDEESSDLRALAAYTLGNIGPFTIPYLRKALKDEAILVNQAALYALAKFGSLSVSAVEDLVAILKGKKQELRMPTEIAMISIGPAVLPHCLEMLKSGDKVARLSAVAVMCGLREESYPVLPELLDLLSHKNPDCRERSFQIILSIGPKALSAVVATAKSKFIDVRLYAIDILRIWGPRASAAVKDLQKIAEDEKEFPAIRRAAKQALQSIDRKK